MEELETSKSERKRQAEQLQQLGRRLTELSPQQLAEVPLPDTLLAAIADYQRFTSHGARRRQLQLIGKRMRAVDAAPILAALDRLDGQSAAERFEVKQLERWRERLIEEPEALTEYLAQHPDADRQMLRQLIGKVLRAPTDGARREAARALFRFLRQVDHAV